MMKRIMPREINLIDFLVTIFISWAVVSYCAHIDYFYKSTDSVRFIATRRLLLVFLAGITYFAFRIILNLCKQFERYIEFGVILLCIIECCIGLFQLFNNYTGTGAVFSCHGTCQSSGTYGGLLAVCISFLVSKINDTQKCHQDKKLLIIAVTAGILLLLTTSRAGLLALACSSVAMICKSQKIHFKISPHLCMEILTILILSIGMYLLKKDSADGRMYINKTSLKIMAKNGIFGVGSGQFAHAFDIEQTNAVKSDICANSGYCIDNKLDSYTQYLLAIISDNENDDSFLVKRRTKEEIVGNAFNEYFLVGVECGWPAMFVLLCIVIFSVLNLIQEKSPFGYALLTFSIFSAFSFPFKDILLLTLFMLFISLGADNKDKNLCGSSLFVLNLHFVAVLSMSIFCYGKSNICAKQILPDKEIKNKIAMFRYWYNQQKYECIDETCDSLLKYALGDISYIYQYGYYLHKMGQYERSDSVLRNGANVCNNPMFWNVMGNNSLLMDNYREAEERYSHAFIMLPNRLYPLYLLAKLYYREQNYEQFLQIANFVEHFEAKIESKATSDMRNEILELRRTDVETENEHF